MTCKELKSFVRDSTQRDILNSEFAAMFKHISECQDCLDWTHSKFFLTLSPEEQVIAKTRAMLKLAEIQQAKSTDPELGL